MGDELLDGDDFQVVAVGDRLKLVAAGPFAALVEDFAENADRGEAAVSRVGCSRARGFAAERRGGDAERGSGLRSQLPRGTMAR